MASRVLPGVLLAVGAASATSAAAAEARPSIVVRVEDRASLSGQVLREAEKVAGAVYDRAGVNVSWDSGLTAANQAVVSIVIVADATDLAMTPSEDSMGVTSHRDGVRTCVAFVFYNRVMRFAAASGVDARTVLGAVIAHELGHLLLPLNAHSGGGVMRGYWDLHFVPRAGTGVLNFSAEHALLLRARLATRNPACPEAPVP